MHARRADARKKPAFPVLLSKHIARGARAHWRHLVTFFVHFVCLSAVMSDDEDDYFVSVSQAVNHSQYALSAAVRQAAEANVSQDGAVCAEKRGKVMPLAASVGCCLLCVLRGFCSSLSDASLDRPLAAGYQRPGPRTYLPPADCLSSDGCVAAVPGENNPPAALVCQPSQALFVTSWRPMGMSERYRAFPLQTRPSSSDCVI